MIAPDSTYSIYIHIPFCDYLCTYCAFNTYVRKHTLIAPYLETLQNEIVGCGKSTEQVYSHSLYFGGGTPSVLDGDQVGKLIDECREHLGLLDNAEISLEANPDSMSFEKLLRYRKAGINRLSIGVQSAGEHDLRLFARKHTYEDAAQAFQAARKAGFDRVNIDLIYGAPGQSIDGWKATLESVLSWRPDHISLYCLTIEPRTSLATRVKRGRLTPLDDDTSADMYEIAREYLRGGGFVHYEISNWAQPGQESVHNMQYWLNKPFLGFGAGAYGCAGGLRYWNVNPIEDYIAQFKGEREFRFPLTPACSDFEKIDYQLEVSETLILGLRLLQQGVSKRGFEQRFGHVPEHFYGKELRDLQDSGLIKDTGSRLYLTERAFLISNQVFMRLLPD